MKTLEVGVADGDGNTIIFLFEGVVINGIHGTTNPNLIERNCKEFNIDVKLDEENAKVTKIMNVGIATVIHSSEKQFQFLVGDDIDREELLATPNLTPNLKEIVLKAAELAKW